MQVFNTRNSAIRAPENNISGDRAQDGMLKGISDCLLNLPHVQGNLIVCLDNQVQLHPILALCFASEVHPSWFRGLPRTTGTIPGCLAIFIGIHLRCRFAYG